MYSFKMASHLFAYHKKGIRGVSELRRKTFSFLCRRSPITDCIGWIITMRNSSKSKRCRQPPVDVVAMNNGTGDRLSTKHHRNNRNGGESCDILYNSSVRLRREDRSLIRDIVAGGMTSMFKGCLIFCSAMFAYSVLSNFNNKNFIHQVRRSTSRSSTNTAVKLHIPSGLDQEQRRGLSLNLGGGECLWQVICTHLSVDFIGCIVHCYSRISLHSLQFKKCPQTLTSIKVQWLVSFFMIVN